MVISCFVNKIIKPLRNSLVPLLLDRQPISVYDCLYLAGYLKILILLKIIHFAISNNAVQAKFVKYGFS